jgi:hypothetical protein
MFLGTARAMLRRENMVIMVFVDDGDEIRMVSDQVCLQWSSLLSSDDDFLFASAICRILASAVTAAWNISHKHFWDNMDIDFRTIIIL